MPATKPKQELLDEPKMPPWGLFSTTSSASPIHSSGLFYTPSIRPPSDFESFSHQFISSRELGAHSLLNMSPAAVDPELRSYVTRNECQAAAHVTGYLCPSPPPQPCYGLTLRDRGQSHGLPSTLELCKGSPIRSLAVTRALVPHNPISRAKRTKRYQYWTEEEDALVKELREQRRWTWKDISGELRLRLGGTHTWQAVQMRYLRAIRDAAAIHLDQPRTIGWRPRPKKQPLPVPPMPVLPVPPKVSVEKLHAAIDADWNGRWQRLSAVLGEDIDPCDYKKYPGGGKVYPSYFKNC